MVPIGRVACPRTEAIDDDWGEIISRVILDGERFTADSVQGLDAIDGSPVLDLKPYMTEFAPRGPVRQPRWSRELMRGYWS
jgi:tRNA (Thr-GGU) A37 N-methylase